MCILWRLVRRHIYVQGVAKVALQCEYLTLYPFIVIYCIIFQTTKYISAEPCILYQVVLIHSKKSCLHGNDNQLAANLTLVGCDFFHIEQNQLHPTTTDAIP